MNANSLVVAIGIAALGVGPDPEQPPASDQFLIVPLRAHVLTAPDLELADCNLKDADVTRIIGKLNTIWDKAGIHFGLESIVREPAAQRDRFRLLAELNQGRLALSDYQLVLPRQSRVFDGLHAFFVHQLPFNGAYLGDDCVIVQERPQLKAVEGGSDEPLPRVLGSTLGQALGLERRREPETSLMASGTNGVALDAGEVERARRVAKTIKGVMTFAETGQAAEAAQAAGQSDRARRLRSWLAEIPGAVNPKAGASPRGGAITPGRECGETPADEG